MSNSGKMVVVLTIVGLFSGGFLTFVYQATEAEVERRNLESLRKAIFAVLPEAVDYKGLTLGGDVIYQGLNKDGEEVGLAFLAEGSGFQGKIKIMVGVEQDLNKLRNIRVLDNVETPGLGGKITKDDFQQQFKSLSIKEKIKLRRGPRSEQIGLGGQAMVQAVTGATISSKAVVDSINQRIAAIKKMMK